MKQLSVWAKIYIASAIFAALVVISVALLGWSPDESVRFAVYFAIAFVASGLRVTLPGICSGISVNFVFILIGVMDLGLAQVICIGFAGTLGQFILRRKSWHRTQLAFNLSSVTLASSAAFAVYHSTLIRAVHDSIPILLFCSSAALFIVNTWLVSFVIMLTERKNIWRIWVDNFLWTGSHHLVGAAVAAVFHYENVFLGWESMVLTGPVIYFVYRSYALHLGRLHEANQHAEELGDLHWRAIEALALAIDAKDETTHSHLMRVKVYATEIGKEMKMNATDMQALQAAALLHDIGKLAVPEYIISKPGKLTPEEFDKMKIHPVVGAEILASVRFPYPVVPMVRSHHEKWNGKGYPDGLQGEEIPLGARILSAVDCLDALASDRQYRRALPLDKAMQIVLDESGQSFDPIVVEILHRRYVELEKMATAAPAVKPARLSKDIKVERGGSPATGFEETCAPPPIGVPLHYMLSSSSARRDFHNLVKIASDLATSLTAEEILVILVARLRRFVPNDTTVIYLKRGHQLVKRYAVGEDERFFTETAIGEGLSGWVGENRKAIVNGNPSVEIGYPNAGRLRSTLSIPLELKGDLLGVLTIHSTKSTFFTLEDQRTLLTVAPEIVTLLVGTEGPRDYLLPANMDATYAIPTLLTVAH